MIWARASMEDPNLGLVDINTFATPLLGASLPNSCSRLPRDCGYPDDRQGLDGAADTFLLP